MPTKRDRTEYMRQYHQNVRKPKRRRPPGPKPCACRRTFAEDIEEALNGEPIEAVVIGKAPWDFGDERIIPETDSGQVLTWAYARDLLNYLYHDGFGSEDCHPVYIWTATRVAFVQEYDGSTTVRTVPRNPTAGVPEFI